MYDLTFTAMESIKKRMIKRIPFDLLSELGIKTIIIGGNSCNETHPNDIDMFPVDKEIFKSIDFTKHNVLSKTKNATTIMHKKKIYQFCSYHKNSLTELVESFDFSNIMLGVKADVETKTITEVYVSDHWMKYQITKDIKFTGSEYPLGSLMRIDKYHERKLISKTKMMLLKIEILASIVLRGFQSQEDFKDQLDAIDLMLITETTEEFSQTTALYELLKKEN